MLIFVKGFLNQGNNSCSLLELNNIESYHSLANSCVQLQDTKAIYLTGIIHPQQ